MAFTWRGWFGRRAPPDGLFQVTDRIYVFDSCFSTEVLREDAYAVYVRHVATQLHEQLPEAAFLVFNFREGERRSQLSEQLAGQDMIVMDYPRQFEGCPVISMAMIHHLLRSYNSWLELDGGAQNLLLMHCERGGWPLLAFILTAILLYQKDHREELRTLEMIQREAPKGLLQLLSPLSPIPSQVRYLQYVTRRNNMMAEWPPPERALTLDCLILRSVPSFDSGSGCRPMIRVYGRDPHFPDQGTTLLFSTTKRRSPRHYRQVDCEVVKMDIQCAVQGDVVVEVIHLELESRRETMMFRVMFNTAFLRSNMLMLSRDDIDVLWGAKERFTKDFRSEVLFGELDVLPPAPEVPAVALPNGKGDEKGGLPVEAFSKLQELFSGATWGENTGMDSEAAMQLLRHITAQNGLATSWDKVLADRQQSTLHKRTLSSSTLGDDDDEYASQSLENGEAPKQLQHQQQAKARKLANGSSDWETESEPESSIGTITPPPTPPLAPRVDEANPSIVELPLTACADGSDGLAPPLSLPPAVTGRPPPPPPPPPPKPPRRIIPPPPPPPYPIPPHRIEEVLQPLSPPPPLAPSCREPTFDITELEALFSTATPAKSRSADSDKAKATKLGGKPEKIHLMDLRRANNCAIMLSKVKMPLPDMFKGVLALDSAVLDVDQVENLLKFCPTKDEMDKLRAFTGDITQLGKCELFFMEMMRVPRMEAKLKVFSFKLQFKVQVADLRANLELVRNASREVRESGALRRIMQTILSLGNALNQGTTRGQAIGFKLDSLLKLTDTRARGNKMTLMHYLCKVLSEKLPELMDFWKEMPHVGDAAKVINPQVQLKSLAEEMQAISKGLEKVEQELTASEGDGPVSVGFRQTLSGFLEQAEAEVRTVTSLYTEVSRAADMLAQYFGEDPARCPFEQVVLILFNFITLFKRAIEENTKMAEAEKKRLEQEAEKERKTKEKESAELEKKRLEQQAEEKRSKKEMAEMEKKKLELAVKEEAQNGEREAAQMEMKRLKQEDEKLRSEREAKELESKRLEQELEEERNKAKMEAADLEQKRKLEQEAEEVGRKTEREAAELEKKRLEQEVEEERRKTEREAAELEKKRLEQEAEEERSKTEREAAELERKRLEQEAEEERRKTEREAAELEKKRLQQEAAEARIRVEREAAELERKRLKLEADHERKLAEEEAAEVERERLRQASEEEERRAKKEAAELEKKLQEQEAEAKGKLAAEAEAAALEKRRLEQEANEERRRAEAEAVELEKRRVEQEADEERRRAEAEAVELEKKRLEEEADKEMRRRALEAAELEKERLEQEAERKRRQAALEAAEEERRRLEQEADELRRAELEAAELEKLRKQEAEEKLRAEAEASELEAKRLQQEAEKERRSAEREAAELEKWRLEQKVEEERRTAKLEAAKLEKELLEQEKMEAEKAAAELEKKQLEQRAKEEEKRADAETAEKERLEQEAADERNRAVLNISENLEKGTPEQDIEERREEGVQVADRGALQEEEPLQTPRDETTALSEQFTDLKKAPRRVSLKPPPNIEDYFRAVGRLGPKATTSDKHEKDGKLAYDD
eukprot:SM000029S10579  [mRNA]  locus=s29:870494:880058:- [translate_table: standard]